MSMNIILFNLVMFLCPINYGFVVSGVASENIVPVGFVVLINAITGDRINYLYIACVLIGNAIIAFSSRLLVKKNEKNG